MLFWCFYSFWRVCLEAAVLDEYWLVLGESVWGSSLMNSFFGQKNSLQISLSWVNLCRTRSWLNSRLLMSFRWGSSFLISWFHINLNKHLFGDEFVNDKLCWLAGLQWICLEWSLGWPVIFRWVSVSSVQSLSHVWLFVTPWAAAPQASLSITNSGSLPKLMSMESVMPSNHLILCHPLLLLPSIFLSIRAFSNESALCIRKVNKKTITVS